VIWLRLGNSEALSIYAASQQQVHHTAVLAFVKLISYFGFLIDCYPHSSLYIDRKV